MIGCCLFLKCSLIEKLREFRINSISQYPSHWMPEFLFLCTWQVVPQLSLVMESSVLTKAGRDFLRKMVCAKFQKIPQDDEICFLGRPVDFVFCLMKQGRLSFSCSVELVRILFKREGMWSDGTSIGLEVNRPVLESGSCPELHTVMGLEGQLCDA